MLILFDFCILIFPLVTLFNEHPNTIAAAALFSMHTLIVIDSVQQDEWRDTHFKKSGQTTLMQPQLE